MKKPQVLLTVLAVAGLSLMYQTAAVPPEKTALGSLDKEMVGEKVSVTGEIQGLSKVEGTTFFTLKNGSEQVPIVMFREGKLLLENQEVKASGRVTIYRGEVELVVNRIEKPS